MKTQPVCPECDKLIRAERDMHTQSIGEFLAWMSENDYVIAVWNGDEIYPVRKSIEDLLAEYADIDMNKVEQERRALLVWLREVQNENQ